MCKCPIMSKYEFMYRYSSVTLKYPTSLNSPLYKNWGILIPQHYNLMLSTWCCNISAKGTIWSQFFLMLLSLPPCERQQLHVRSLVRMISYRGDTSRLTALQLDTKTSLSSVSHNETSHFSLLTLRGDSDTKASLCHGVG